MAAQIIHPYIVTVAYTALNVFMQMSRSQQLLNFKWLLQSSLKLTEMAYPNTKLYATEGGKSSLI